MNTYEYTTDLLAKLYQADFNGKKIGRFRIARTTLAMLAGRHNIEQPTIDQIKLLLSEKHDLVLIDLHDEFAILKCSIPRRYRKATNRVVEDILGITCVPGPLEDDD